MYNNLAKPLFIGKKVIYMPSCHSTNEVAMQLIRNEPVLEGTVVITDNQMAGRGQQGSSWEAEQGMNLTFSLILTPKSLELANHFLLNIIVSLGVTDYLDRHDISGTSIKWPNDIYHVNGKLGGILIQNTLKGQVIQYSVIGIGLNINQKEFHNPGAHSVGQAIGKELDLHVELEEVLHSIESRYLQYKSGKLELLNHDYLDRMMWKDEVHTFEDGKGYFMGIIRGINSQGQLIIKCEENERYFNFKEVTYIK